VLPGSGEGLGERRRAGGANAEECGGARIDVAERGDISVDDRSKQRIERDEDGAEQIRGRGRQRGDHHDGDADDGEEAARLGQLRTWLLWRLI
jgi:hypothetical protein